MAKISMLVPDNELAEIDAQAGGNRTAFMVAASVQRARHLKRERTDAEIVASLQAGAQRDALVYAEWECTLADGLDGVELTAQSFIAGKSGLSLSIPLWALSKQRRARVSSSSARSQIKPSTRRWLFLSPRLLDR